MEPGSWFVGSTWVRVPKRDLHPRRWQERRWSHLLSQRNGCHSAREALTYVGLPRELMSQSGAHRTTSSNIFSARSTSLPQLRCTVPRVHSVPDLPPRDCDRGHRIE